MVLGYFGRTPVEPDAEIVRLAEKQLGKPVFKGDPLEVIEPGIPKARAILEKENLPVTDENIFIIGALATPKGNKGLDFLKGKMAINVRKVSEKSEAEARMGEPAGPGVERKTGPADYKVTVEGKVFHVTVEESSGEVKSIEPAPVEAAKPEAKIEVRAKLQGIVSQIFISSGDWVEKGDTLMILEAMKMETPVVAPSDGTVVSIKVEKDQVVKTGQLVAILS